MVRFLNSVIVQDTGILSLKHHDPDRILLSIDQGRGMNCPSLWAYAVSYKRLKYSMRFRDRQEPPTGTVNADRRLPPNYAPHSAYTYLSSFSAKVFNVESIVLI